MSEFHVTFLGTSASMPTKFRNVAATLIQFEGQRFLVDCGEGTQRQMMTYGGLHAPDAIFLTHYHPDHDLGLPGLFASLKMAEHTDPIRVYGPPGLDGVRQMCVKAGGCPKFVQWHEIYDETVYFKNIAVTGVPSYHGKGVMSQAYVFQEDERPGRFDVEKAKALGIEPGPDYKALQAGESLWVRGEVVDPSDVIGAPRKGRKVAITGDTRPTENLRQAFFEADLLVHEATFTSANALRAKKTCHSTVMEATLQGRMAFVKQLVLHHFSPRELMKDMLEDVLPQMQSNTLFARDGDTISIPVKG